jgi:TATA-box binding protein (TBP) (component of TFIID and TFIIIB)
MSILIKSKHIDDDISNAITNIRKTELLYKFDKPFKLTTCTILIDLGSPFDFQHFLELYQNTYNNHPLLNKDWSFNCSPRFYNCIFFKHHTIEHNISIKLFRNGKLHLTGLKSVQQATVYADLFCKLISPFTSDPTILPIPLHINIQLINATFKIQLPQDTCFCLKTLYSHLQQSITTLNNINCSFNNDYHSAVKLTINDNNKVTVLIFESGSILLLSCINGHQLEYAHNIIIDFIMKFLHQIIKPTIKSNKKRKKNFDYSAYI